MTNVLPTCFANRGEMTWQLSSVFTSGGQSVFGGETQIRRTDGGGGWRATLSGLLLKDVGPQKTWSALNAIWNLGETGIIVPVPWSRLLAGFVSTGGAGIPWSDGVPFDDDSLWAGGDGFGVLTDAIALRATELTVTLPDGAALLGGEPFTMTGPTYGARLYTVAKVTEVDGNDTTITFSPPAREAYAAGIDVDFQNPRCTMRAVPTSESAMPAFGRSRFATASMMFEETFY